MFSLLKSKFILFMNNLSLICRSILALIWAIPGMFVEFAGCPFIFVQLTTNEALHHDNIYI